MEKYQMDTPLVQPVPRENREYLHTTRAAVAVPFSHSVITAVIVTTIALVPVLAFRWRGMAWWLVMLFLIVLAWDWNSHRSHWFNLTSDYFTQPTQPQAEAPNAAPRVIRVELPTVTDDGHYSEKDFNLPDGITMDMMEKLAVGILETSRPFTYREWAVGAGKVFTDPQYRKLQDLFEAKNLIEKKGTGFVITDDGKRTLESFLPSE
jgi:hypothetical protein